MNDPIRSWIDRHRLASFLLVAYAFTWTVQGALLFSGMEASWTHSIIIGIGAFGPAVGAAVVVGATGGDLRTWVGQLFRWRIGRRWWLLALGLPFVILVLGTAIYVALGGPVAFGGPSLAGIYLFAMAWGVVLGGGQEELGWRGFMLPVLQERYSALVSSVLVGAAWAGWHLPLFLNPTTFHGAWPLSQRLLWGVTILAGSVLWTWMYNATGGSVLAVAVFHAGINAMGIFHPADVAALAPEGIPDPWLTLLAEGSTALVLVAFATGLVAVYGADRLARGRVPGSVDIGLDGDGDRPATSREGSAGQGADL
jgi:membrane protease YdiL (CAAX protease family)